MVVIAQQEKSKSQYLLIGHKRTNIGTSFTDFSDTKSHDSQGSESLAYIKVEEPVSRILKLSLFFKTSHHVHRIIRSCSRPRCPIYCRGSKPWAQNHQWCQVC